MLSLLLAVLAAAPAPACEYKEAKKPPQYEVELFGGAELRFSADPKWFNCRKKAGDTLEVVFSAGEGEALQPIATKSIRSYGLREAVFQRDLCASGPGMKKVRAEIRGTGELARLAWTSEVGEVFCPRCEFRSYDNMFVLHSPGTLISPKGMYTIEGTLDERWFECAKKGSTLELYLFAAPTQVEAREMKEPTHRVRGLESKHYKKAIPQKDLCRSKPKWIGYELHGTGEFTRLNRQGRGAIEAKCP